MSNVNRAYHRAMPARGSYAKGVAKRDEVLSAALTVFSEKGYLKTSIRDLAEAANLSQSGLLHYFGSKEELLVEILRRRDQQRAAAGTETIEHFLNVMHENVAVPGLAQLSATLSAAASDETHPAHDFFIARYRALRAQFTEALRQHQANGGLDPALDVEKLAALLIAAADGLQTQWLIEDTVDMPGCMDYLWDIYQQATPPHS